jgi:glycosyltransferase involved in cell wall biosynthesis
LPERAIKNGPEAITGPIRFGYFGAFSAHAGLADLIRVFTATDRPHRLRICGWGKAGPAMAKLCEQDSRLEFLGFMPPDDCLKFAQGCDVLVNPRPSGHGNENNFPSKIFEYALCARAIVTTRISGVDAVLGEEAFYIDENDFDRSLAAALDMAAAAPRDELNRRGRALCAQATSQFNWPRGAGRMAEFVRGLQ